MNGDFNKVWRPPKQLQLSLREIEFAPVLFAYFQLGSAGRLCLRLKTEIISEANNKRGAAA
jgi:hypothetical protein